MHRTNRPAIVLLTVLAAAPAVAAEDPGIELPTVPAAVVNSGAAGLRFVKVAATADGPSGTDRVLELGPKTVTVEPGTTALVEVAINHLNRIVPPFAAPQVRTVSTATTQVDGNVVYVATASEEPVVATTAGTTQPFQQAFSSQAVQAGAVKGVGSALDRLANYFMDMAEEMFPVIEVDAGRGIEFVLNRGATLRLGRGRR